MTSPVGVRTGWPLYLGMAVAGAAAVVASASTLAGLARTAGWAGWTPWLLPAALDVGGSAGGWCWLRPGAPSRARTFGRVVALVGATGTLVGNATGHLIASGYLTAGPLLVVVVGAVPAAVLMALAHLAALLATPEDPATSTRRSADTVNPPASRRARPPARPSSAPNPSSAPRAPIAAGASAADTSAQDPDTRPLRLRLAPEDPAAPAATEAGSTTPENDDASTTRYAVLAALERRPSTIAELVRSTGRSRTTIVGHLTALTDEAAIARGTDKRYHPVTEPDDELIDLVRR